VNVDHESQHRPTATVLAGRRAATCRPVRMGADSRDAFLLPHADRYCMLC
jgi:hypothetical protein